MREGVLAWLGRFCFQPVGLMGGIESGDLGQGPFDGIGDGRALGVDDGDGGELIGWGIDVHADPQEIGGRRRVGGEGEVKGADQRVTGAPEGDGMAGAVGLGDALPTRREQVVGKAVSLWRRIRRQRAHAPVEQEARGLAGLGGLTQGRAQQLVG